MANKEMKTIQFPNSETVYEIVDNAAREALAGKQPSGNYATTESLNAHTGNTNNPHGVTKSQVGLENVANERQYSSQNPPPYPVTSVAGRTGAVTLTKTDVGLSNVDNTSDTAKPVSTAQATAIAEAKQAGTNAQNAIDTHAAKVNNPHKVTAAQVGAYVKPAEGIPETDLSAEVQEKLNSSGGDTAVNLLQSSVTANRQAGVAEGDMVNLGYALGLEEGKMYTVKYKFNGVNIVATAKYEAVMEGTLTGATLALCQSVSAEGETMSMPILLGVQDYNASLEDYQSAALDYGFLFIVDKHQIAGDESYTADENNSSVYPRALQSANAQNAVSVEITSIEPYAEVVADKVKNPLTIGDVVFDGSSAKTVALPNCNVANINGLEYRKIMVISSYLSESMGQVVGGTIDIVYLRDIESVTLPEVGTYESPVSDATKVRFERVMSAGGLFVCGNNALEKLDDVSSWLNGASIQY